MLNKDLQPVLASVWEREASRILRSEVKRAGCTYAALAHRLQAVGLQYSEHAVRNKLSRGSFGFDFVLQVMYVLGQKEIDVAIRQVAPKPSKP